MIDLITWWNDHRYEIGYYLAALITGLVLIPVGAGVFVAAIAMRSDSLDDYAVKLMDAGRDSLGRFFNHILDQLPLKWRERLDWEAEHW